MAKIIQPSMAGGEISPAVGSRVDLSKRSVAVELAENFIATFTGSMRSRPGSSYVAQCKPGAGPHRIIEFEFNTEQTFVLELGDQYMRFHSLGAQILDSANVKTITAATAANPVEATSTAHGLSNGDEVYIAGVVGMTELNGRNFLVANVAANTFELQDLNGANVDGTGYTAYTSGGTATPPYEVTSPWAAADLFDIKYAQSGDIMTLCHPDYTAQELIRIDNDTWTLTDIGLIPDTPFPVNIEIEVETAAVTGAVTGITQANPAVVTVAGHGLADGERVFLEDVVGMVEVNRFVYVVNVLSANTFEIAYQFNGAVDSTGFTAYSSGGTITKAERPRFYTVTAISADDGEESLRGHNGDNLVITNITQANPAVVTFAEGHGLEDLDQFVIEDVVGMTELNGIRFHAGFISATQVSLSFLDNQQVDSTSLSAYVSGGNGYLLFERAFASAETEWRNTITWDTVAGIDAYNIYATDNFGVFGFLGTTQNAAFEDKNLDPDYSVTPPIFRAPFQDLEGAGGKDPSTTGFFQQRRIFANSITFPNRFWMSQLGHFNNFASSIPPLSDDAITASIAARRINEIKHIVPLTDLAFLTSGGEYRAYSESGVITPATLNVKPQSYYGSTDVRPVVAGDVALYISPGQFIRSLKYEFADDSFMGQDITVLARHLFEYNTIIDWDYAPAPYATGFLVRDDGSALSLTYQPDQDVYAWTRATTRGKYKSTCVVREGTNDITYVTVERIINGNTVVFLERFDEHQFEELSDAFCVDAGLSLDAPVTITGATAADPVVVTAPSHGFSNGDTVDISGILEIDDTVNVGESLSGDYNGTGFTIANATTNTFELQNVGTDYDGSAFAAYSSGGAARKAVTTVSGLWHLEGATVVAAANGYSEKGLTVANGSVTLQTAASRIHIGLGYFARLTTLPLTQYADGGTTEGRSKNINRLTVQVERTMGMWFGPSITEMRENAFGAPALYGQPLELVTGDIDVTMKANWGKRKQVVIEQRDPLPLTVLALIPDGLVGGN